MNIYVIVALRQRPDLLARSLASIAHQSHDFVALVGDDASTEDTGSVLDEYEDDPRFQITRRTERVGVLANQVMLTRSVEMQPEDLCLVLDGDDRFAHADVLAYLADVFSDPMIDVSYGNYEPDPPCPSCPPIYPIPAGVCESGRYLEWSLRNPTPWNHARVMRRRIFDAIPDSYMKLDGEWLDGGADYCLFNAALQLAGGRHRMITETLIYYTSDRPDAEWRSKSSSIAVGREYTKTRPPLAPLPPMVAVWSCSHCGPHPKSDGGWCAAGCGRDYNRMTRVVA